MLNEEYKLSPKAAERNRTIIRAAIANYEAAHQPVRESYTQPFNEERLALVENTHRKKVLQDRYVSFGETVRSALVTEAIYKIYKEATADNLVEDTMNRAIMRSIVSEYVAENGCYEILNRMKKASVMTSQMYNTITETAQKILESVDKDDPNTFTITPDMKDEFFKQLDYSDSEAVSDAIKARVSDEVNDFVTANAKDHEDINAALKDAQDKIENVPETEQDLREAYEQKARRQVLAIRTAPKNVFHAMVSAVCESTLKNQAEYAEFMHEGHLNVDKVVDRVALMYTFMETLNTARMEKIDEAYIESMLENLRQ